MSVLISVSDHRVRVPSLSIQVTYVRRSYFFWERLETADSTFQTQDPNVALIITFTSRNTLGEKTTSTFTLGKIKSIC